MWGFAFRAVGKGKGKGKGRRGFGEEQEANCKRGRKEGLFATKHTVSFVALHAHCSPLDHPLGKDSLNISLPLLPRPHANSSPHTPAQCAREGCDGSEAFFYQVQIRSADEPMTTFYKVRFFSLFGFFPMEREGAGGEGVIRREEEERQD